jgi:nuclear GTP-binding protein
MTKSGINKKSMSSSNPNRPAAKQGQRDKATIQRLNMYNSGKPIRNKGGRVVGGQFMMSTKAGGQDLPSSARVAPDRRWFGNTRTISQTELEKFRDDMTVKAADPYSIVLRRKKIPMALLQDSKKVASMNLLETESYDSVFGGKNSRKRPKLDASTTDYSTLMKSVEGRNASYEIDSSRDSNIEVSPSRGGEMRKDDLFAKGQSRRIWAELYKVLDCSDVVLEVLIFMIY